MMDSSSGSTTGGAFPVATTSNNNNDDENNFYSPVMLWEDPFSDFHGKNLCNLPYRTIDIDVQTCKTINTATTEDEQEDHDDDHDDGTHAQRIDTWNQPDEITFRPYRIREAINEENRRQSFSVDPDMLPTLSTSSDGSQTPPFAAQQRIFFVCFHLPVVCVRNKQTGAWQASWSESLLAKSEGSQICSAYDAHWVGTVTTRPPITSDEDKEAIKAVLKEMNCTPLFLDPKTANAHYYGFCKQVLWPAFHNIDILDLNIQEHGSWDQSRLSVWWDAFQDVNQAFSKTMMEVIQPNDILWIHDYHLSLLPRLLAQDEIEYYGRPLSRKVFFLHIPFPTSQIFRELDCGECLLEGMLHANVIGFHAFDHARHFLNACKRILGLQYETLVGGLIGVHMRGRTVMVTMSNVSIEPRMVNAALSLPTVELGRQELHQKHGSRLIIAGCDVAQRLQGIALKLLAFERLLKDYPNWQAGVVMVQRVIVPGSRKDDEVQTLRELRALVKRIQETFGEEVIDYVEVRGTSYPMDQRLALWKASAVLMATPIREGLNHWPMEYIYAHKAPERPGVVITSEFSAVSSILNGALRVNPYDIQMTITTIAKALTMDDIEREGRLYRDIDFVSTCPSDQWTKNVLRDLKDAIALQQGADSQSSSALSTPNTSRLNLKKDVVDSTAAYLARESALSFQRLNHHAVEEAYKATTRRVFILDFNGTIVIKEPPGKYLKREILGTSGNKPVPEVIEALTKLCADPANTVYVVSGDSAENVISAIGNIPGMGLAVSNGAHFAPPLFSGKRKWHFFDLGVDWDAVKRVALPVLSKYTARSNGSFVKLTQFSIGWSYYSCDPEWGSLQASHLVLELENELRAFDVRFVTLKGVVEILPRKLNKGLFVKKVLRDVAMNSKEGIDFILCMGDDISDEKMFTSVFSYIAEIGDEENAPPTPPVIGETADDANMKPPKSLVARDPMYNFTVAVGKKPSHASQWVTDAVEVGNLLVRVAGGQMSERQSALEKNRADRFA